MKHNELTTKSINLEIYTVFATVKIKPFKKFCY